MVKFSQKSKKYLLILPLIPITIALIYSIILEISAIEVVFLDYHAFYGAFQYYPEGIYDFYWYIYTPAFLIEFFWIGIIPFYLGVTIWVIIKIAIILYIWKVFVYSDELLNINEFIVFIILVLIFGMINEIHMENSDVILLACGFLGYYSLDKAQKMQFDDIYENKYFSKSQLILILNAFAGIAIAFGLFKPLFFIILPLLFFKSNKKLAFIAGFLLWLIISNFLFILYPELLIQYIGRVASGQTLMHEASMFESEILNSIFRNGFTPFRIQLWLFPTIMMYIHEFVKNEKIRKYWALWYATGFAIFNIISLTLLGFGF